MSGDLLPYGFTRWNPPDPSADQDIEQEGGGLYDNDGRYMDSEGDPVPPAPKACSST